MNFSLTTSQSSFQHAEAFRSNDSNNDNANHPNDQDQRD